MSVMVSHMNGNLTFLQQHGQANKEGIQFPIYWPFQEIHWWPMDSSHKKQVIRKSFLFYDIFIRFANGRWQFILKRSKYRRGYSINVKWYLNISLSAIYRNQRW